MKTQNKKVISYVTKQGMILKKFRDTEQFFLNGGQSKTIIHFKMGLHKFMKKYPALKRPTLSSNYFKNNFNVIKTVCRNSVTLFL